MALKTTLDFLIELAQNNNKPWFEAHRTEYFRAKQEIELLALRLLHGMADFAPEIKGLEPKDCTFRIHRDVRFSKKKSPYKQNMALYICPGGKKAGTAGYYIHIEPGASFVAGGYWMPEPVQLAAIRQEIDYHFDEFLALIQSSELSDTGFVLDTSMKGTLPPKGYEKHNPAIEYIKLKSFVFQKALDLSSMEDAALVPSLLHYFRLLTPFIRFLNVATVIE